VPPAPAAAPMPPPVGRLPLPVPSGSGQPLAPSVAGPLRESFGVDLSHIRVHSDAAAAHAAASVGARAFALGHRIILGRGERPTDLALMAHEVAHVVQQRGAAVLRRFTRRGGDAHEREAQRAAAAVVGRQPFTVRERTAPRIQRLGLSDALDYFADKANLIPGFRMFTIILGVNPVNMRRVDRTAANILRAVIEFIPGGALITQALDNHGVFEKAGAWIERQIDSLGMSGASFKKAIDQFLDSLSWRDIFNLGGVWERAKRIFTTPIGRLIDFAAGLVTGIVKLIKDAILLPLAKLAEGTRGYDLLKAILGQDPITGEAVPRNAETLIGGFMKLIGKEEVWENIKKANAIPRAWAWFQGALAELLAFVRAIPGRIVTTLKSLEVGDIVLLPRAFLKVGQVFASVAVDFLTWGLKQVLSLLQIIFEVLAPAVMPYLRKAMGAFKTIIADPIRFIGHLVKAGVTGFKQFAKNFLSHLRTALIQWLTGALSGAAIYIPQAFEIREIIKFVLSVLGLTWANIRAKLVKAIPEVAVKALETAFDIVVVLVKEGPAAAWEKIKEQLTNLKEMVMEQVMTFVQERIVQAAITKLLTSLNPAGAFVQAIIAIYNTVMFVVERLSQIARVVAAFIDSIAAIAAGAIGAAANRVEQTMAGLLTLVISFLARLVGLGKVSDAVLKIVNKIRAPIDKALDKVVEWIVNTAKKLGKLVAAGVARITEWWRERRKFKSANGVAHDVRFKGEGAGATVVVASVERPLAEYIGRVDGTAHGATVKKIKAVQDKIYELRTRDVTHSTGKVEKRLAQPSEAVGREIAQLLEQLAKLLETLPDPDAKGENLVMPESKVITSKERTTTDAAAELVAPSSDAEQMVAQPLSIRPGGLAGSAASHYSQLYMAVKERGGYIAGHLLSAHLHGPGTEAWNLAPITESANRLMASRIESIVHRLVFNTNKVVRLAVSVKYGTKPGPVIPAEGFLPTQIKFVVKEGEFDPGAARVAAASPGALDAARKNVDNWKFKRTEAEGEIPSLAPLTAPLKVLTLDTATGAQIKEKTGCSENFAAALVTLRPFGTKGGFETAIASPDIVKRVATPRYAPSLASIKENAALVSAHITKGLRFK
jgi:hypothetical protein